MYKCLHLQGSTSQWKKTIAWPFPDVVNSKTQKLDCSFLFLLPHLLIWTLGPWVIFGLMVLIWCSLKSGTSGYDFSDIKNFNIIWIVKAMVFPVVMYGCESCTTKKAECWKIDAFKLLLEMTLQSLLDSKEINPINPKRNQPWIFIGKTDAETEAILWLSDMKRWLIRKDPDGGKNWGEEEKGWQRMRWLDSITVSMDMNLRKLREIVMVRETWHAAVHRVTKSQTWLSDWTTII